MGAVPLAFPPPRPRHDLAEAHLHPSAHSLFLTCLVHNLCPFCLSQKGKADAILAAAAPRTAGAPGPGSANRPPAAAKTTASAMDTSAKADLKFGEAAVMKAETKAGAKAWGGRDSKRKLEIETDQLAFERDSFSKKLKADDNKDTRATGIRKAELTNEATAAQSRHDLDRTDRGATQNLMKNTMAKMAAATAAQLAAARPGVDDGGGRVVGWLFGGLHPRLVVWWVASQFGCLVGGVPGWLFGGLVGG